MNGSRSSEFLKCFWDLATDSASSRIHAIDNILAHLSSTSKSDDLEYALKRLIKGLCSSRSSARLGFSSCFTCVLSTFPNISLYEILKISDESTKLSGASKGMDERDIIFGKLFCYLAIIRSGRLIITTTATTNNTSSNKIDLNAYALDIFNRIFEIHDMRGWIKEVTVESILAFLSACFENISLHSTTISTVLDQLVPLVSDPLTELAAWQITLLLGLKPYLAKYPELKAKVCDLDLLKHPNSHLDAISTTLLAATAGFPKIHRVWEYIIGEVIPLDKERQLPSKRSVTLSKTQEDLLLAITSLLEARFLPVSHEKRGVALRLSVTLLQVVPAEYIPNVLTKQFVRLITAARGNKKHTLHEFTLGIVQEWGDAVKDSVACRLALASVLVQHGDANFDSLTGSRVVGSLLLGMDRDSVLSHVQFLCAIIASGAGEGSDEDDDDENRDNDQSRIAAVEAMVMLAKNNQFEFRNYVTGVVIGLLVRISCFSDKAVSTAAITENKGDKKKKSKKALTKDATVLPEECIEATSACLIVLEKDLFSGEEDDIDNDAVIEVASNRLLSLLADIGSSSYYTPTTPTSTVDKSSSTSKVTYLDIAFAHMAALSARLKFLRDEDDDDEDEEGALAVAAVFKKTVAVHASIVLQLATPGLPHTRCWEAAKHLLVVSAFQVLGSDDLPLEVLYDVARTLPKLLRLADNCGSNKVLAAPNNDDEDEMDGVDALDVLYDASAELMCVPEERPSKGVREALKRVWQELCHHIPVDKAVLDKAVARVVHVLVEEDTPEEGEEEDESEGEESEDEEAAAVVAAAGAVKTRANKEEVQEEEASSSDDDDDSDDEDDESDSDSGSEGMALEHDETADAALAEMINLRKKSRKQGVLDEKKRALLLSTRCIDFLEIILRHCEVAEFVLPQLIPLLTSLQKLLSSSTLMTTQEGKSFESKLKSLVETRICKSKLRFQGDHAVVVPRTGEVIDYLQVCIRSPLPSLKHLACSCFVSVLKTVIAANHDDMLTKLGTIVTQLLADYLTKKKSNLTGQFFDDLILRFGDFSVTYMVDPLLAGLVDGKTAYLRSEAFRLFSALLKKTKSLQPKGQQTLLKSVNAAVAHIATCFDQQQQQSTGAGNQPDESNSKELKAKHFPIVLSCCKDILPLLSISHEGGIQTKTVEKLVDILTKQAALQSKDSLKKATEQMLRSLEKLTTNDSSMSTSTATTGPGNGDNATGDDGETNKKRKIVGDKHVTAPLVVAVTLTAQQQDEDDVPRTATKKKQKKAKKNKE